MAFVATYPCWTTSIRQLTQKAAEVGFVDGRISFVIGSHLNPTGSRKETLNRRIFMLGEKIGGAAGKVTSQRVLPNPSGGPKMETSFQSKGTLLGTDITETGTYWSIVRPDGTLYGEGQGVLRAKDGKMATWIGQGVGTMKKTAP
jgi:hypothetical protein